MDIKGVNQERLAGRLDVESSTVSKLLTGRQRLSDIWLSGIAGALDIEVADLFLDPNRPSPQDILDGLTDEQKSVVINMIDALKKSA